MMIDLAGASIAANDLIGPCSPTSQHAATRSNTNKEGWLILFYL